MAKSKEDVPKLADVEKENAELKAKIQALKDKLGITAQEDKEEATRIKQTFGMFDRDNDGFIDKNEFELLAFECGTDVAALTPENLQKAFAAVNPKGDGKITLEDFSKWLKMDKGIKSSKGAQLGLLRMKLQSKAWLARLNDVRAKFGKKEDKKAPVKADKSAVKVAAKEAPKDVKEPAKDSKDSAKDSKDAKLLAKDAKDMKLLNLGVNVGEFKDAKAGVYLDVGENEALAKATRDALSCPDGVNFFAYVDFALKDGAEESKLGELAGALEAIMSAVPWQQMPMQVYHSHNVDVANSDGKKVLRVTVFSSFDPEELARPMLEASNTELKTSQILSASVKVETPFALDDLKEPQFRFTPENMKARLAVALDVNRKLKDALQGLVQMMPPEARLSILGFFVKGVDINVNFANLDDFLKTIPEDAAGPGGHRHRSPGAEIKEAIGQLANLPIADMIPQMTGMLPQLAQSAGQKPLYDLVKANVLGLRRVHIQMHELVARINLRGMDFVTMFP
jgi:hypothetical protein